MICHKNFEKCLLFKRQITVKFQKKLLLVGHFFSWKTLYLVLVHVIIQQIKCILFLNVMRFYLLEKKYLDPRFWEGRIHFKFMFTLILVLYKLNFVYFYLKFVNRIALLEYFNFFFASLEFILYLWLCTNKCEHIDVHWWCAWRKLKEVILLSFMIIVTGLPKT